MQQIRIESSDYEFDDIKESWEIDCIQHNKFQILSNYQIVINNDDILDSSYFISTMQKIL